MIRRIIKIDEDKCNGCGACAIACHEGAIKMINSKAKLTREDYCDGLGDCLPACPVNAIAFEEREALEYDESAVLKSKAESSCSCQGSKEKIFNRAIINNNNNANINISSQLRQWPVQIKLSSINATYYNNSSLLIAADCTAYAYASFHNDFIKGNVVLIGCPKLDNIDYTEKLTHIIKNNNIKDIKVVKMEVPCCNGIERAVKNAIINSNKNIDLSVYIISTDGRII